MQFTVLCVTLPALLTMGSLEMNGTISPLEFKRSTKESESRNNEDQDHQSCIV